MEVNTYEEVFLFTIIRKR